LQKEIKAEPKIIVSLTMASIVNKDFFCERCKLQFDKKIVYDIHLKIIHKEDTIKSELVDTKNDISIETSVDNIEDFSLFEEPINGLSNTSNMPENVGNVYEKPLLTNADLIVLALKSNKDMAMVLNDIYTFIKKMFPYFKNLEKRKWQNPLRHTLTERKSFVQDITKVCRKNGNGRKSCAWTFNSEEDVQKMSKMLLKRFRKNFLSILDATPTPHQAYLQQIVGYNKTYMASPTLNQPWVSS
jgi:hypothetical protein